MSKEGTGRGAATRPLVNDKLEATTELWRISPYSFCDEVRSQMTLPEKLQICDLTLREGRQIPSVSLRMDEVLLLAEKLVEAGVTMFQSISRYAEEVAEIKKRFPSTTIDVLISTMLVLDPALCREQVDKIVDHGADIVEMPFVFSDSQMCLYESMAGARISREDAVNRALASVGYAKDKASRVCCLIEDVMRMDLDFLKGVARRMVDAGASIIRLDDINNTAVYPAYKYVVREMKKAFPDTTIALHTHNDLGLGAACLYAGVEGGAEIIDASTNGLGERAGLPALAEVAAVMQIYYGIDTGIRLEKMKDLSELVADLTKYPVPPKMPCVGDHVFSHLSESHYKSPPVEGYWAYLFWHPSIFGNRQKNLLGPLTGPWIVRSMAKDLGITIPDEKVEAVAAQVCAEVFWRKRELRPEDFLRIVDELS